MLFIFSAIFVLTIFAALKRPWQLNEGSVAIIGVLLLLLTGLTSINDVANAITGNGVVHPYQIIIILASLALITTTMDAFGFFKHLAHRAIVWSRNDGCVLFRNFFFLTVFLTGFTSNDIDILTITPVVLWFSKETKVNPIPYLFAIFVAANTSSMEFLIGNLTNIIIATTHSLQFVHFFLVMILPTVLTLLAQYGLLRWLFRKELPSKIVDDTQFDQLKTALRQPMPHKKENIYLVGVLTLVIILSALSDFFPFSIWMATLSGAILVLLHPSFPIRKRLRGVPWNVVLFVGGLIIFSHTLFSFESFIFAIKDILPETSSILSTTFVYSLIGAVASGFINNIPAALSLGELTQGLFLGQIHLQHAIAYGLVIGTNLGALFSPIGALATILWLTLIRRAGFSFPLGKFISLGVIVGIVSILVSASTVALVLSWFQHHSSHSSSTRSDWTPPPAGPPKNIIIIFV